MLFIHCSNITLAKFLGHEYKYSSRRIMYSDKARRSFTLCRSCQLYGISSADIYGGVFIDSSSSFLIFFAASTVVVPELANKSHESLDPLSIVFKDRHRD